jgi:hypothetical protein
MLPNRNRASSLTALINYAEQQALDHQRGLAIRTEGLQRKIKQQLTSSGSFMLAGAIGYFLGEVTRYQPSKSQQNNKPSGVAKSSLLNTAMKLLISVQTLYRVLPLAWIIQSFYKSDPVDPKPQSKMQPGKDSMNAPQSHKY